MVLWYKDREIVIRKYYSPLMGILLRQLCIQMEYNDTTTLLIIPHSIVEKIIQITHAVITIKTTDYLRGTMILPGEFLME